MFCFVLVANQTLTMGCCWYLCDCMSVKGICRNVKCSSHISFLRKERQKALFGILVNTWSQHVIWTCDKCVWILQMTEDIEID